MDGTTTSHVQGMLPDGFLAVEVVEGDWLYSPHCCLPSEITFWTRHRRTWRLNVSKINGKHQEHAGEL